MKKRVFVIVLALLMLCSAFPLGAFATTQVDTIGFVNAVLPVAGETPVHNASLADPDALYFVTQPAWYKISDKNYVQVGESETFVAGKSYYFRCVVNVKSGYAFNPMNMSIGAFLKDNADNKFKLDGLLIENTELGKKVTLEVTCKEAKIVKRIDFRDIVMPIAGEAPANTSWSFADTDAFYMVQGPAWCGLLDGKYLALKTTFSLGTRYYFRCVVNVKPGYKFDPLNINMTGSLSDAAGNRIKLDSILIENHEKGKQVTLGVTCIEKKTVKNIDFKNVVMPVAGQSPDNSAAFVNEDELYFVTPAYWYEVSGGHYYALADTAKFEAGKTYYFRCKVNVKPGYQFDPMNLNLNGSLSDAAGNRISLDSINIENDAEGKLVTLGVKCEEAKIVRYIDFTDVVMPVAGETPDNNSWAFANDDALYMVSGPTWVSLSDGSYIPVNSYSPFVAGVTYYFRCVVNVKPGYQFDPMNINMNGSMKDANGVAIKLESILIENHANGKRVTLGVKCTEAKIVKSIDFTGVVKPVAGEAPDNSGDVADIDALVSVTPPMWYKVSGGKYVAMNFEEKFEEGKTYYFRGVVDVNPGYKFDPVNINLTGSLTDAYGNKIKLDSILIENDPDGKLVTLAVKCEAGSPFMLGDVDDDKNITASDARLCLRRAVDLEPYAPGSREFRACDVDKDGSVTANDARSILRAAVDLEDPATW